MNSENKIPGKISIFDAMTLLRKIDSDLYDNDIDRKDIQTKVRAAINELYKINNTANDWMSFLFMAANKIH